MIERAKAMFHYDDECLVEIHEVNSPTNEQVRQMITNASNKAMEKGKDVIVNIDMDLENYNMEFPLPSDLNRWNRSVKWAGGMANIVSKAFSKENLTGVRILYAHSAGVDATNQSVQQSLSKRMYDNLNLLNGRTNAYSLARALKKSGYGWWQVKIFTSKWDLPAVPWSLSNYDAASRKAGESWVHLHSITFIGHNGLQNSNGKKGTFIVNLGLLSKEKEYTVEEIMSKDWRQEKFKVSRLGFTSSVYSQNADIWIDKYEGEIWQPYPEGRCTFILDYGNWGEENASNIIIEDIVKPPFYYIAATPTPTVVMPIQEGTLLKWLIDNLATSSEGAIFLTCGVDSLTVGSTTAYNTATITCVSPPDSDLSDNISSFSFPIVHIEEVKDLWITMRGPTEVVSDETINFTINYGNLGSGTAGEVSIVSFISWFNETGTYVLDNDTLYDNFLFIF